MPFKEVEDRIHYLYQIDKSSQGQHPTQGPNSSWTIHNYNQSSEKKIHIREIDSLRGDESQFLRASFSQNNTQLTPVSEFPNGQFRNRPLNTDCFMFAPQDFLPRQRRSEVLGETTVNDLHTVTSKDPFILNSWQENACGDSPTLTTNSERSEITEASFELNNIGAQKLVGRQPSGIGKTFPMQQSGYNDMQLYQQRLMLKQLQDIQRQQQFQQCGDARLQNSSNDVSDTKQATGVQFSPLINGIPVNDASLMFMNWVQLGASPATQGVYNRVVSSQDQGQAQNSMSLVPQQLDVSLYGNPIANARGNMNQYSHHQGITHNSTNLLTKASGQTLKPLMQSSASNNHFVGDHVIVSADQVCYPQGSLVSKQGFQGKQNFGEVPFHGVNGGCISGNLQPADSLLTNSPVMEINGRQERAGWPGTLEQKALQLTPSENSVPLNPMEEKLLYNMDNDIWGTSFGRRNEMCAGGFGSMLESTDDSSTFPSLQSGSWSALMQSAVAEASSSDTGLQEEWSGLTFQNTEQSNDNQASNIRDNERQQDHWVDSNLHTASSLSSTPFPMFTDSSASSDFPGFQPPRLQFLTGQRESMFQDISHVQMSSGGAGIWSDSRPKKKDDVNEPTFKGRDSDGCLLKEDGNYGVASCFRTTGGLEQVQSLVNRKGSQVYNYSGVANSSTIKGNQGTNQEVPDIDQSNSCRDPDNSMDKKDAQSMIKFQLNHIKNGPHVLHRSNEGGEITYDKQQRCYQRDNIYDAYNSKGLSIQEQRCLGLLKFTGDFSDCALTLDKGSFPDFQGNSNASKGVPSGADVNMSATLHGSVRSNVQSSLNMLELLHKVDESKEDSSISHINSGRCYPSSPQCEKNELQTRFMSTAPVVCPSLEITSGTINKHSPSNLTAAHEDSSQNNTDLYGQKFPVLETLPVSQSPVMPVMSQQAGLSVVGPHNVWRSVPIQGHVSGMGSHNALNINMLNNFMGSTSSATEGLKNQMLQKDGYISSEFGVCSSNSPGFECGRRQNEKEVSQQISSKIPDASQTSSLKGNISDANAFASRSLLTHVWQQDLDKMQYGNNQTMAASGSNLQSFNHPMHPSNVFHHNYSLQHQVQAMKNVDSDDSNKKVLGVQLPAVSEQLLINADNLKFTESADNGQNPSSFNKLLPHGDTQMESPLAAAREDLSARDSLQPSFQDVHSQHLVESGKKDSQSQLQSNVELTSHAGQAKMNLSMAPSWFKQYSTSVNGPMAPFSDARVAKNAAGIFPLRKPFQSMYPYSSLEQIDAASAIQSSRVLPERAATLATSVPFPSPHVLPSNVTDQSMTTVRPKKRKTRTSELLPWYKEVTEGSGVIQNISVAEQGWAQATNKLFEKVEDEMKIIEDGQPMLRSKRRLVLTTQLMQQLFGPPPSSVLSANSSSHYDSMVYSVAKLSLGDACSQTHCSTNDFCMPLNGSSRIPENITMIRRTDDQYLAEVVETFNSRAKKMETDLLRLDKAASILDLRAECQELERFSVIHRLAKFHTRQAYASAILSSSSTSASAPKKFLQKHVNAYARPTNLPEDAQCLSL
ncbi:putative Dentin sialophosphoprotein-related [Quillaja saponaria]|uniref:Dentin sialophosphoprotein-related n=1 Tax=Quillaja saponaria TaxID=32244 RepID=A0AAD7VG39_QUISA|nr:putative Dentin sialophosphoprotein-related [Quillaja saponaria]